MAMLVKSIPTFLMHVFAPVLGVCLAAWFIVLLVSAARGAPQTFGARPRAPRGVVWAGLEGAVRKRVRHSQLLLAGG